MIRTLILISLILLPFGGFSQNNIDGEKAELSNGELMRQDIIKLKSGVLLVYLQTKINSVNALKDKGKPDAAFDVEEEQKAYNKDIIKAFKEYFTFCPVYFFYSNDLDKIKNKDFDHVVFLNDSLQPDPSVKLNNNKFLMAEFATTFEDSKNKYDRSTHIPALIIKDDQFHQLRSPFPYYSRTYHEYGDLDRLEVAVVKMNKKLFRFYNSSK